MSPSVQSERFTFGYIQVLHNGYKQDHTKAMTKSSEADVIINNGDNNDDHNVASPRQAC